MKKQMNRLLSLFLSLVMVLGMLPAVAPHVHATEHINDQQYASLIEDCRELERLLTAIIKSAKT